MILKYVLIFLFVLLVLFKCFLISEVKMNYFGLILIYDLNLDNLEIGMNNVFLNLIGCIWKL